MRSVIRIPAFQEKTIGYFTNILKCISRRLPDVSFGTIIYVMSSRR